MQHEVVHSPAYSLLKVALTEGEEIHAEPGALVLMQGVEVKTSMQGGVMKSLMRSLLGGESVWINTYRAKTNGARVWLSPPSPGDILYLPLESGKLLLQDRAYLAHHGEVEIGVAFRGFKGFLSEGQFVWLKAEGSGGIWMAAFGALEVVELAPGERVTVDNFHTVAMDGTVEYKIRTFGGLKSALLGGEGLVMELQGPGRVVLQTRTEASFVQSLLPFLPKEQ